MMSFFPNVHNTGFLHNSNLIYMPVLRNIDINAVKY